MASMSMSEPLWGLLFDGRELAAAGPMVLTRFGNQPTDYSVMFRRDHENVSLPGTRRLRFLATEMPSLN